MRLMHNDVEITVESNGKFVAMIGIEKVSAGTMASIKKKIEEKAKAIFEPFAILDIDEDGDVEERQVVGIRDRQRHHHRERVFVIDRGQEWREVIRATPKTRKAAADLLALRQKNNKVRKAMDEAEDAIREKLIPESPK